MKLLNRKQFLETANPTLYVRWSEVKHNGTGLGLEIKRGIRSDIETGQPYSWYYQPLWDIVNPEDGPEAGDWISTTAQMGRLENGLSVPNCVEIENDSDHLDEMFLVFELEDMQSLIIPLAECFDTLTKEMFKPIPTHTGPKGPPGTPGPIGSNEEEN